MMLLDTVNPRLSVNVPFEVFAGVNSIDCDSESTLHNFLLLGKHHLLDPVKGECLITGQVCRLNNQHDYLLSQVMWHVEDAC